MSFAHPPALFLLLMLVPVVLLYRLRVRAPRQTVGTGLFWQKALAEEKARGRWQRWRSPVSLAVQMIIVALIAMAAAGPQVPAPKRIVLIIDNSATMRATDVPPTRMDAAKATARRLVENLRSCDEMAVVAVSPAPIELQPLTSDRELLDSAVDSVQAMADPAAIDWAVKLAREISMPDKIPPRIVMITDACAKEATQRAQASGLEVLRVGTAAGNLAITCFTARRSRADPSQCEVLVEVRNQGDQLAQGSVTIAPHPGPFRGIRAVGRGEGDQKLPSPFGRRAGGEGGSQFVTAPFSIVKDGRWQHVFTLGLPSAARLTAKIEPGDSYVFDDTADLDVPAAPAAHRVKPWEGQPPWKDEVVGQAVGQAFQPDIFGLAPSLARTPRKESVVRLESLTYERGEYGGADIRVPNDLGSAASALVLEPPAPPLWLVPAVLAAALVIIEWCLYQRRWTT
jgi:hypothetical protein